MDIKETELDYQLNIDTCGRDACKEDDYHYPYEPTPYCVLERLVENDYISYDNIVIDYGCGKGRIAFFLNDRLGCKVIGIDFDERMYIAARKNLQSYSMRNETETNDIIFLCENAEKYEVEDANIFYFFNPFSVKILQSVIGKIIKSYYYNPRVMQLFFYYPSDEYISYLMSVPELCFVDEIECSDLFKEDHYREKILIFELL